MSKKSEYVLFGDGDDELGVGGRGGLTLESTFKKSDPGGFVDGGIVFA